MNGTVWRYTFFILSGICLLISLRAQGLDIDTMTYDRAASTSQIMSQQKSNL